MEELKRSRDDAQLLLDRCNSQGFKRAQYFNPWIIEFQRILAQVHVYGVATDITPLNTCPVTATPTVTSQELNAFDEFKLSLEKLIGRLNAQIARTTREKPDALAALDNLCSRFHNVARRIRKRHDDRPTIEVNDEYDVQDLLHALLSLHFDDIRPEEWTPSYAGGSKRMDFLLKEEQIVVEVKKTRGNLGDKQVGEQLIIDIETYKVHPDCRTLVCFVYDPEGRIANPTGLETDLMAQSRDGLKVVPYIFPK